MTKKTKKPRNYRATEATFINVGASKKRDTVQNARIAALEKAVRALKSDLEIWVSANAEWLDRFKGRIEGRIAKVERKAAKRR